MSATLRIICDAFGDKSVTGFVKSFNPDAAAGFGHLVVTPKIEEAQKFDSAADALACWKQQPTVRPLRPDGRPNRPLSAFTCEIEVT